MADDSGILWKLIASAVIIIAAIPGLVVEPGPLSEIAAIGLLFAVWSEDKAPGEAVKEASGSP